MSKTQQLSDLLEYDVCSRPFFSGKTAFKPYEKLSALHAKAYRFTPEVLRVVGPVIGDPPDIDRLEAYLAARCGVTTEPERHWLTWPQIITRIELGEKAMGERGCEVAWDPDDSRYMPSSDAIVEYTKSKLAQSTLSRKLTENSIPVHFMRKAGCGCRVHRSEFRAWAIEKYPAANLSDLERSDIADEVTADREAIKQSLRGK